jgi:hypothetical protein
MGGSGMTEQELRAIGDGERKSNMPSHYSHLSEKSIGRAIERFDRQVTNEAVEAH